MSSYRQVRVAGWKGGERWPGRRYPWSASRLTAGPA
jgi:hypothetical protein